MEENEKQATNPQGGDLSHLTQMFSNFRKQAKKNKGSNSRENILAKYFVPRNTKETFRILPVKKGKKYFEVAFFHVVPTITAGGKTKYNTILYCPAHNDPKVPKLDNDGKPMTDSDGKVILVPKPCPLCEKHKKMLAKQDLSLKGVKKEDMNEAQLKIKEKNDKIYKDAIVWSAKKFYILRGIDKGAEKDGVKFWRFKHNYKNQGTLDKLLPILEDYTTTNNVDFSDPQNGTDLSITMTDSEWNGRTYKSISAISAKGKSPLHADPLVKQAWLEDEITWRDVFKPKKAPNITEHEYLELVANNQSPYWDDTDANNKHWVFPGHPELEEKANTRTMTFDNNENENFEQASDVNELTSTEKRVTISNVTESDVGEYNDDATNVAEDVESDDQENKFNDNEPDNEMPDDYDDLPF